MKTLLFIAKKYWLGNKKQLLQLCTVIPALHTENHLYTGARCFLERCQ